ncbi:LysR family transcriptional regulator [Brenneria goodwinii]|uniref:LysR family transcriptional regulator n=1 Tax=Brenneria goodwinii TaxID=1109412 RepID=UPI0036E7BBBF
MDLKRLRYFCKVVEQSSFSKAAQLLNMAQPPLSKRIQELEEELNVSLFMRKGNRIETTDAGYFLYRKACKLLREVEDTARETILIANSERYILRIGLTHLFQSYFKPLFLELHRRCPHAEINVMVSDSSNLECSLNDKLIDVALIQRPYHNEGYDSMTFNPVPLVAVVSKKIMPIPPDNPFPYLELGQLPLILLHRSRDSGVYEILLDLFRKGGVNPNVLMHITQPGVILDWLESGLEAATLLPSSEVDSSKLQHCHVLNVFPSPLVFFPALVKTPATPYMTELLEIVERGYPF